MAARKKAGTKKKVSRKRGPGTGQPPFVPTDEQRLQVELMVGIGLKYFEIASLIINPRTGRGISMQTLQTHFQTELQAGRAKVHARVAQSLFRKAISDNHPQAAACAMFMLKCQFGWVQAEKVVHEIEGQTSGVLVVPAGVDPKTWVAEQEKKNRKKKPPAGG